MKFRPDISGAILVVIKFVREYASRKIKGCPYGVEGDLETSGKRDPRPE